jgi:drug/metabolite transporter (DMT)-like permease
VSASPRPADALAAARGRTPPRVAIAVAVVAVSTSAILVRVSDAPEPVMAFYRVAFTVCLLAPFAGNLRTEVTALRRDDLLAAAGAGLALAAHFALWFASVDLTTVAASVTLVQTQPLFVAVGATLLLGEPLGRRKLAGILVALAGVAAMSVGGLTGGESTPAPLLGDALALAGAVALAVYVLAGRSVRQRVALLPYVLVVYAVAAAGLLAVAVALGHSLVGYPPHEWGLFLAMAVGPGVLGHTLLNWALAHVESSVVSVSLLGEPVGSTLLALAAFGEVPGALTVAGGAVVLGGISVTARASGP